jgi:hypothetical protein
VLLYIDVAHAKIASTCISYAKIVGISLTDEEKGRRDRTHVRSSGDRVPAVYLTFAFLVVFLET